MGRFPAHLYEVAHGKAIFDALNAEEAKAKAEEEERRKREQASAGNSGNVERFGLGNTREVGPSK